MSKVTEKTVRTNTTAANGNSKHMLVGLQSEKGSKYYTVTVVARKTGAPVQVFGELSASEANAAVTMFDLCARVTALQVQGLAAALNTLLPEGERGVRCVSAEEEAGLREALTKFAGRSV